MLSPPFASHVLLTVCLWVGSLVGGQSCSLYRCSVLPILHLLILPSPDTIYHTETTLLRYGSPPHSTTIQRWINTNTDFNHLKPLSLLQRRSLQHNTHQVHSISSTGYPSTHLHMITGSTSRFSAGRWIPFKMNLWLHHHHHHHHLALLKYASLFSFSHGVFPACYNAHKILGLIYWYLLIPHLLIPRLFNNYLSGCRHKISSPTLTS